MKNDAKRGVTALMPIALVLRAVLLLRWNELTRLFAVNTLFSDKKIIHNFSHMNHAFLHIPVLRGDGPVSHFSTTKRLSINLELEEWIVGRQVTALVVLKDAKLAYENYYLGTQPNDLRISWSVAKSFLSALTGILLEEGAIGCLDDPVVKYAPTLKGSAYDQVSLRNVLQMSSGVLFDEEYLDKNSDINRMGRELALGGTLDGFAASLQCRFAGPGEVMQYVSIDTHVIGMVLRGATGRSIPDLLSDKIIRHLGFEQVPYYVTDGKGVAFALGGLNLTARDYARFGLMIQQDGEYGGKQIVPKSWIRTSTIASAKTLPGEDRYGYQWWIAANNPKEGEFFARGIYGQYIYIDRDAKAVITVNSANTKFLDYGVGEHNIEVLRSIVAML
ncbi:MAG: serine hydrolase [Paracoccaceae bacterium]|nr:serine hydrolase [Paracoccaceae bacterium]